MTATLDAITEAEWQQQVVELAHILGWRHMHCRRSIGKGRQWVTATNVPWPDLTLWHPKHGLIFAELKSQQGGESQGQTEINRSLRDAGQRVYVWRPSDLPVVKLALEGALS